MISTLLILNYHRLTEKDLLINKEYLEYTLDVKIFEQQIDFLSKNFQVVSPEDWLKPSQLPLRIGLTFDDGNYSDIELALPILEKHGMKAMFFPVISWIGKNEYLSIEDLKILVSKGHSIQAHSINHSNFVTLSKEQRKLEIENSIVFLKTEISSKIRFFALPFGNYFNKWEDEFKSANINHVLTTGDGINRRMNFNISRKNIKKSLTFDRFQSILEAKKNFPLLFLFWIKKMTQRCYQLLRYLYN